jgi:hypothetical protein
MYSLPFELPLEVVVLQYSNPCLIWPTGPAKFKVSPQLQSEQWNKKYLQGFPFIKKYPLVRVRRQDYGSGRWAVGHLVLWMNGSFFHLGDAGIQFKLFNSPSKSNYSVSCSRYIIDPTFIVIDGESGTDFCFAYPLLRIPRGRLPHSNTTRNELSPHNIHNMLAGIEATAKAATAIPCTGFHFSHWTLP